MKASAFSYAQATVAKKDSAQFLPGFAGREGAIIGAAGAAAAVANAVNDALRPFGAMITEIPLTRGLS
jgi:hypothetical protein